MYVTTVSEKKRGYEFERDLGKAYEFSRGYIKVEVCLFARFW